MTKKLFLIAFILLSVKLFATNISSDLNSENSKTEILGNSIDYNTTKALSITSLLSNTPLLLNFRTEDINKNRLYFDSSQPINGSNISGFTISGKTITSISVNTGQTTGHYFTVSSPFSFWSNNTIRYNGGSDIGIYNIDMEYITNNISEPSSSNYRYVSSSASGNGNGLTENTAWTLSQATSNASSGMTIWIKAGNYGNGNFSISRSGTATAPIKFIGYQSTIGDKPNLNWSYPNNTALSSAVMPLLKDGSNNGITVKGNYVIIRNFQVDGYKTGIMVNGSRKGVILDNIYSFNSENNNYGVILSTDSSKECRLLNSVIYNAGTCLVRWYGTHMLINNVTTIQGSGGVDYYIVVRGNNNIVRNSHLEHGVNKGHTGHGISVKSVGVPTEYGLYENLNIIGIKGSIEARHDEVKNNVFRSINCIKGPNVSQDRGGGILISHGANNNIFDKIYQDGGKSGVQFYGTIEDPTAASTGHGNIIKNSVFSNSIYGIRMDEDGDGKNREIYNNQIINSNFYNNEYLYLAGTDDARNNNLINCNITNTTKKEISGSNPKGWDYQNCNFFSNTSFSKQTTNGNVSHNPLYISSGSGDFHLQPTSPINNSGVNNNKVFYDADGVERVNGSYSIGAYDDAVLTTGSVSPDTSICVGESTTLIASGGDSYLWNTGETTANLTVSPSATTTYSVTVTSGSNSDSHDVIVTVNTSPTVDAGSDVAICFGENVTLTATGIGDFLWSTGETTSSIVVNPLVTTRYTVTANNSCATEVSDDIEVIVNPEIALTVSPDVSICSVGDTAELTATGNGSFLWSTGETTPVINVNPSSNTTYTVTATLGDCSESENIVVSVEEFPTVDAGLDVSICYGEDTTLTATGNGNFLWSTGETTNSILVNPLLTTTYTVTASNSCADVSDEVIVTVNPEIELNAGSDVIICYGEDVTLTATGNGSFLWSTGETTPSITISPNITSTITVTSTLGDCSITDEVEVTVNEAPSVDVGSDISICSGDNVTLTASGVGDFLWNTGETTESINVSPTSTTTYTVTASNSCSTDVSDEIIVTVNPGVEVDAGLDVSICSGENITLTATGNGNFLWSTGETTNSITVSPSVTTTYNITTTLGDCSKTDEVKVTVYEAPSVDVGSDISICSGDNVTLTANGVGNFLWSTGETTESITVNPTNTTTYTVTASNSCSTDVSDDIIVTVNPGVTLDAGPNVSICSGENITLTAQGNGTFLWNTGETTPSITVSPSSTAKYTVTSSLGACSKVDDVIVTVNELPRVSVGSDVAICFGENITLTATGNGNFLWNTGETTSSISVSPSTTTTYTVTASNSCEVDVTDDIIVNVYELPSVNAGDDTTIFNGESTTLTATGTGSFLWSTGETSSSITVNPTITTTYSVVVTSDQGCLNQDTVIVNVNDVDTTNESAGPDKNICLGSDVLLTANGGESYLWSNGEAGASIIVSPTETTVYTVLITNGNTHSYDDVTVYVDEDCSGEISLKAELSIYPNPTSGVLNIEMIGVQDNLNISLFSLNGSRIYDENVHSSSKVKTLKKQINLSRFARGIYIVRLGNKGDVYTKKVLLN